MTRLLLDEGSRQLQQSVKAVKYSIKIAKIDVMESSAAVDIEQDNICLPKTRETAGKLMPIKIV